LEEDYSFEKNLAWEGEHREVRNKNSGTEEAFGKLCIHEVWWSPSGCSHVRENTENETREGGGLCQSKRKIIYKLQDWKVCWAKKQGWEVKRRAERAGEPNVVRNVKIVWNKLGGTVLVGRRKGEGGSKTMNQTNDLWNRKTGEISVEGRGARNPLKSSKKKKSGGKPKVDRDGAGKLGCI